MKTYKFQIKPTKVQEDKLNNTLDKCRTMYNTLLGELNEQKVIDKNMIQGTIPNIKICEPEYKNVYAKTLQYECYRLFSNLRGLSQSKKKGRKVGSLRFKGKDWFKTFMYNQLGFKLIKTNKHYDKLNLSKIGNININCHREIGGNIKAIQIKKKVNTWIAHIITDEKYVFDSTGDDVIGIDMGVLSFLKNQDGMTINNPLFLEKKLSLVKSIHKRLSKTKKGSKNRRKVITQLQRVWETIDNQKSDFFHKVSTKLVKESKLIAVEDLNIKNMVKKKKGEHHNKRNILDSSWGRFLSLLQFKAESAGIDYIKVNPKNTTKMCSDCGMLKDMPTHIRTYKCSCGLVMDRDQNASINILNKALGEGLAFVGGIANV